MNRRELAIVLSVLGAVLIALVILLVTGGGDPSDLTDDAGDATVTEGSLEPEVLGLADIIAARVFREGDEIVFEGVLEETLPAEFEEGSAAYRWDVFVRGERSWLVSANLSAGIQASVVSEISRFGASTVDEGLPGSVEVVDDTVTVRLTASELPDFPETFEWSFSTLLDADRSNPASPVASDFVPSAGTARFDGREGPR